LQAGDPQELNAIDQIMSPERTSPLLIGSVKSNMGHSETVSGLCGIIKCAMAIQTGIIPPNLHFEKANPDIPSELLS